MQDSRRWGHKAWISYKEISHAVHWHLLCGFLGILSSMNYWYPHKSFWCIMPEHPKMDRTTSVSKRSVSPAQCVPPGPTRCICSATVSSSSSPRMPGRANDSFLSCFQAFSISGKVCFKLSYAFKSYLCFWALPLEVHSYNIQSSFLLIIHIAYR